MLLLTVLVKILIKQFILQLSLCLYAVAILRERAVQEMRRQGVSFSSLRSSSPLSVSISPRPASPEHSILRTPERSTDKSGEK